MTVPKAHHIMLPDTAQHSHSTTSKLGGNRAPSYQTLSHHAHPNSQPCHPAPYLHNYAGRTCSTEPSPTRVCSMSQLWMMDGGRTGAELTMPFSTS